MSALDSHGGSLKAHPAQIKPPSFASRVAPEQSTFRRHAAATRPTPWVVKAFQHEHLGKSGPGARAANLQPPSVPMVGPLASVMPPDSKQRTRPGGSLGDTVIRGAA
jgi:hypothetical protein